MRAAREHRYPNNYAQMWDTIGLANPIVPENATKTTVSSAPTTKTSRRNRATWVPRVEALSPPIVNALDALARLNRHAPRARRMITG